MIISVAKKSDEFMFIKKSIFCFLKIFGAFYFFCRDFLASQSSFNNDQPYKSINLYRFTQLYTNMMLTIL